LWERKKAHETAILQFIKEPHLAFTHNRDEQDLRRTKVKQMVLGGFRAEQ
jgi:transposase